MNDRSERDDVMAAIHETVEGLHAVGVIDKRSLREFTALTLGRGVEVPPGDIPCKREHEEAPSHLPES